MFVRQVSFTEPQLREAIAGATSFAAALRAVGLRPAGGNHATIKRYAERWKISTDHFGPRGPYPRGGRRAIPLEDVLVRGSTYSRSNLKSRLYDEGLKEPWCELCGQTEEWRGNRMAMILDHINGEATDNRLANLRIVCPNCNATLETHCGRNKPRGRPPRICDHCDAQFRATHADQRFCSRVCSAATIAPLRRLAERPPLDDLLEMVEHEGYLAVGRRFGVSDNAIRKWLRAYGVDPPKPGHGIVPPPAPPPALSDEEATGALASLAAGTSVYAVARSLGVCDKTIRALKHGRTYRHLERPSGLSRAA